MGKGRFYFFLDFRITKKVYSLFSKNLWKVKNNLNFASRNSFMWQKFWRVSVAGVMYSNTLSQACHAHLITSLIKSFWIHSPNFLKDTPSSLNLVFLIKPLPRFLKTFIVKLTGWNNGKFYNVENLLRFKLSLIRLFPTFCKVLLNCLQKIHLSRASTKNLPQHVPLPHVSFFYILY